MLSVSFPQPEAKQHGSDERHFSDADASVLSLIRPGFARWTASEAGKILELTRYPRQVRDLTPAGEDHKAVLMDLMRRGKWRDHDKIDFAQLPDGRHVLVNGHHRLAAQEKSGRAIAWTVAVHRVSSEKEIADLYYTFDTNNRTRSNQQIVNATGLGDELELSRTMLTALLNAVPLLATGLDPSKTARDPVVGRVFDVRFEMAREYRAEAVMLEECLAEADTVIKRRVLSQGATAVALVTLRHQPERARPFWKGIGDNNGLVKGDPRHTYLRTINAGVSKGNSNFWTAAVAAAAWNAWFKRNQPKSFNPGPPRPIKVLGTPFERGR